jgi:hypothetical protein
LIPLHAFFSSSITEDDVSEIRQDINKFRYEMIDILRKNNFETPAVPSSDVFVGNKRSKQTERRILKGFNISSVDNVLKEAFANQKDAKTQDFFKVIAKAIGNKNRHQHDRGSVRYNQDLIISCFIAIQHFFST